MTEIVKRRISDFCTLNTGGTPSTSVKAYYEGGTVPWLVSGDIHKGIITKSEKYITNKGVENSNARFLPCNSVLIALNGQGKTRGTVALLRLENATCNQSLVAITPNESVAIPEYLFYNLRYRYAEIRAMTGDNERSGLSITKVGSIVVSLPPLFEQRRIAAEVERRLAAVENAKRAAAEQMDAAQRLPTLYLQRAFEGNSWKPVPLGKLCERIYSGGTPSTKNPAFFNGDIPWVTSKDMKTLIIQGSQIHITRSGVDNSSTKMVPPGSLLMVVRSGILKHTLPVAVTACDVAINQDIKAFIPKKGVMAKFLLYSIMVSADHLLKKVRATTADNIELEEIVKLPIPLPQPEEQQRVINEIEHQNAQMAKIVSTITNQNDTITAMPAAILRQAFSGQL